MTSRHRRRQLKQRYHWLQASFHDMAQWITRSEDPTEEEMRRRWRDFLMPLEMCDVCGQHESWLVIRELVGYSTRYLVCETCYLELMERAKNLRCRIEEILDGMAEHGHLGST